MSAWRQHMPSLGSRLRGVLHGALHAVLHRWLPGNINTAATIPDALWQATLDNYPFLQRLSTHEQQQLRTLCQHFLLRKQFTGVQGLQVTDSMAVAIAAQACVLVLHWGSAAQSLRWYDDFVGIVLYPHDMLAPRMVQDEAGVLHHYTETIAGEAMDGGPISLSWSAIDPEAAASPAWPGNVVIHEFAHKLDMAAGGADGCPPLPAGFMGLRSHQQARALWARTWQAAYDDFCEALSAHTRFGQPAPWLDPYAATDPAEFFAVACEAYWVAPAQLAQAHPSLMPLLDALFARSALPPHTPLDAGSCNTPAKENPPAEG